MATATVNYSSNQTITMDLANLGTSATFVAGRESNQIDNTSNKYIDALVSGIVYVGTTPTANTTILVYVWGADTSLATTPLDPSANSSTGQLDGTDSAETLSNTGILNALRLGATIAVPAATSDLGYNVLPFSVASLFGGVVPKFWGLYVAHNTGVNLRNNTVNTDSFEYVGIKYDIA
jgi:hypothetical protein